MMYARTLLVLFAALVSAGTAAAEQRQGKKRPNVIVIITDDQGHGDLGIHGNPKIRTPHLDKFARQGTRFRNFYVSPVCSPTRASLLTGRYNYRTGVVDTFLGRSMMHPDEVTLAQMLAAAGYRTGIVGKWHLGDNFPLRDAQDRGFHESLTLKGGGIAQPSDPPGGSSYFNPILYRNGKEVKTTGYCTDVFTDEALRFVTEHRQRPFFLYVAFNCPHGPFQVPAQYEQPYSKMNLAHSEFPKIGQPLPGKAKQEEIAKVYGMVTNIDDNIGRLLAKLDELKLSENTIVIFLTDNGPQGVRYNSGMLGRKGTVHEGGTRVPFFVRWTGTIPADRMVDRIAAHIDVPPTLLEACGVAAPKNVKFDGRSLWPLLQGGKVDWPDRTLFTQWHRGDVPQLYRAFGVRTQQYRLVQPLGVDDKVKLPVPLKFQLYDIEKDPYQQKDLAAQHPEVVAKLLKEYEVWFKDVSSTRGFAPPRIHLGAPQENPTQLTRQDWRGPRASWGQQGLGYWEVEVTRPGTYEVTLLFAPADVKRTATFQLRGAKLTKEVPAKAKQITFTGVKLDAGPGRLEPWLGEGQMMGGVLYVEVRRQE